MLILLIQSFDVDKVHGRKAAGSMKKLLTDLFLKHGELDVHFTERSFDQLGDLVVDWEHDQLHHSAEEHCLKFDAVDMIVISGDLTVLPWEPQAMQLVSLIHMAKFSMKPLIGVGFGAFATIYSLATKGARFNILNAPNGDLIDQLPSFGRYSIGSGAFPSGWLDKETGDIYSFHKGSLSWRPVCNIGVHSVALQKESVVDNDQTLPKHLELKENFQSIGPSEQMTVTKKSDGSVLHLLPKLLQHPLLKGVHSKSNHFNIKVFHEWRLNRDGALPPGEGLLLLGEGKTGPLLLTKDRMLILAMRYEPSRDDMDNTVIETIISNFLRDHLSAFRSHIEGKIERSMHEFLFGPDYSVEKMGEYDTAHDRKPMAPPLARKAIPSTCNLPNGPIKTDPPAMDMFFRPPKTALDFDFSVLIANRRSSNVGKKPKQTIQNPLYARQKRLEAALLATGHVDPEKVISKSMETQRKLDRYSLDSQLPETNKDMLAGVVMNDSSITSRRHRNVEYQRFYESIFPKGAPMAPELNRFALGSSSVVSGGTASESFAFSSQVQTFASGSLAQQGMRPQSVNFASMDDEGGALAQTRRPFSNAAMSPTTSPPSSSGMAGYNGYNPNAGKLLQPAGATGYSPAFLAAKAAQEAKLQRRQRKMLQAASSSLDAAGSSVLSGSDQGVVPKISDWVKVFQVTAKGNAFITSASSRATNQDNQTASPRTPHRPAGPKPSSANHTPSKSPFTNATLHLPKSPRVKKVHQYAPPDDGIHPTSALQMSPRGARDILAAKVQSLLPPAHPQSVHTNYEHHPLDPTRKPFQLSDTNGRHSPTSSSYRQNLHRHNSGSPRNSPRSGNNYSSASHTLSSSTRRHPNDNNKSDLFESNYDTDTDDDEDEDEDKATYIDGVVKVIVAPINLPPTSAISFYVPSDTPEQNTDTARSSSSARHGTKTPQGGSPRTQSPRITSRYKNWMRTWRQQEKEHEHHYEGRYTIAPEEIAREERALSRSKFVAGEFKLACSREKTALEMRPVGLVRPHGPYPEPPTFSVPNGTVAADWIYMHDLHPAGAYLAGTWK